jgi:alpha-tubulin suppressor-like RCC1 family protein
MSHTVRSRLWHARAAVLLLALISAVLLILSVSDGRYASADTPPQVDPWAWGRNDQGQLGNGTTNVTDNPDPVQVSNLTDMTDVAAGNQHSLAIKSNGTVWAWGSDGSGQLGDGGTNTNQNAPVQASGLTDVVAVAAGLNHSLAVKNDGTVYAWGSNSKGQLGYDPDPTTTNTFENSGTPGQVSGLTDVVAVAGGTFYSLALKSNGTVYAWGNNDVGQLGNGTTNSTPNLNPVQVVDPSDPTGFLTGVMAVAAGSSHSLAATNDGAIYTWGFNSQGMLGYDPDPTTPGLQNSSTPGQVSGLTGVTDVAGGNFHSVALKSDGTVWAWGANDKGQLGHDPDPTTLGLEPSVTPGQVKDHKDPNNPNDDVALTDVVDVSSGLNHNLAATSTHGAVWAWGCNDYGQLGNESVQRNPGSNCASPAFSIKPVQTIGLFNATEVAGGGSHSLALASNDNMAPSTTNMLSPAPNDNGWNSSDVTVTLNATDTGGSGVKEITYSATGAQAISSTTDPGDTASIPITTEGETTITYSAKDNAGNVEAPENTLTVKLDKSAPMVVAGGFAPTGKGVPRGTNITAEFSDEMEPSTLVNPITQTSTTVKLVNTATGKRVKNVVVSYDEATKTVTLDPFGPSTTLLARNTKYKVTITTGAMNLAGLALDQNPSASGNQPKVWTFTTGRSA